MAMLVSHGTGGRSPPDRLNCPTEEPGMNSTAQQDQTNRVDTSGRLKQLRSFMSAAKLVRGKPLKAYIITSDDEHQV